MRRCAARAHISVAEIPGIGRDGPVGIRRAGAVERHRRSRLGAVRPAWIGHRFAVRHIGHIRRRARSALLSGIVRDDQRHGVEACGCVGMYRSGSAGAAAISEIPVVRRDRAVWVGRSGSIHLDPDTRVARIRSAGVGHRWLHARTIGDVGRRRAGAGQVVVVGHCQRDGEGTASRIAVRRRRACSRIAVTKPPGVGHDRPVRIAGAGAVECHLLVDRAGVGAAGARRGWLLAHVDRHGRGDRLAAGPPVVGNRQRHREIAGTCVGGAGPDAAA